jgi:protein TonB
MRTSGRYSTAFVASAFCHAACLCVFAILSGAVADRRTDLAAAAKPAEVSRVVWVTGARPSGGGGGGGDRSRRPATRLERRGRDVRSVPPAPNIQAAVLEETRSVQRLDLPVVPAELGLKELPGAMVGVLSPGISQGPGDGGGAGTVLGPGIGPGRGPGLGPGADGLMGGGVRMVGGATNPTLLRSVQPRYTEDAMRARLQGVVELDAVVLPDGGVGEIRVVRSLDRIFGLDERAIDAVKQWRFRPAAIAGQPVAALVRVELTFGLR